MSTPLLKLDGLTKAFFGVRVLHGVAFELNAGDVLGIVGENGSGKSTTMNIAAGILAADGGVMHLNGAVYAPKDRRQSEAAGVAFIQQELNIFPNLSVAENLFLGRAPRLGGPFISRRRMLADARQYLDMVELAADPAQPAGTLSAGERQLLEIARALSTDARLMIFDEPTTSLTAREAERLFALIGRLRAKGLGIIYISHTLEDVLVLSSNIVVMRDGVVTLNAPRAGLTARDLVAAMVGRSIEALFPARAAVPPAAPPVLEVANVGQPGVVGDISFTVRAGEIVGIAGLMGAGRTELARILFGLDPHHTGTVRLDGRALAGGDVAARIAAGAAFLTEDRRHEGAMMDASVADNFTLSAAPLYARKPDGFVRTQPMMARVAALARALKLKSGPVETTAIRTLSGGNQQKVLLGRWMMRDPRVFILDEPTRGVDVGAKQDIYALLAEMAAAGTAVILISSEIEEVMGLADRILVMHRGRFAAEIARADFEREKILNAAFGQERAA